MEAFKISIFEDERKKNFPRFKTLSVTKSEATIKELSKLYHLDISDFKKVQEVGEYIVNTNATKEDFSPTELFVSFPQPNNIMVIWGNEDLIDVFHYEDFCKYFDYIWYPSSDDILIINELLNIAFLIRHDGIIYRIHSNKQQR